MLVVYVSEQAGGKNVVSSIATSDNVKPLWENTEITKLTQ